MPSKNESAACSPTSESPHAGNHSTHESADGTQPGNGINKLSAESLAEVGVDISDETPKPIDRKLVREVDLIITLGREADLESVSEAGYERWHPDGPSERGIDGIERMRLVRDDIARRVADLLARMHLPSA